MRELGKKYWVVLADNSIPLANLMHTICSVAEVYEEKGYEDYCY